MDYYNMPNSIYCYPGTNLLKNKLDIHDSNKLFKVEKQIVLAKLYILRQNKMIGNFDMQHIQNIHKFLFEDIYDFAGKFRKENISKTGFTFASWEYIEPELNKLLNELKKENFLKNINKTNMANRLAYYLSELNVLHPFREGNGRTIGEFIRQLAYINGYYLDLTKTTPEKFFQASVKSAVNTNDLVEVFNTCLISEK